MTESEKNTLLRKNTILWIAAMAMPAMFDLIFKAFASGPVKFPWPIVLPMLMVGLLLGSNNLISEAIGKTTDEDVSKDGR